MSKKVNYIDRHDKYGINFGLENIYELLNFMNIPYNKMKIIHIAGTNGKGSVGAFLMYLLSAAGYKVGRFSSPTVFEDREFAQIMDKNEITNISEMFLQEKVSLINELNLNNTPSGFEVQVAISYSYFIQNNCDIVIVETGMGGALDATNVFESTLCDVITSIGMDHMDMLGDSIEKITLNKCGIITDNGNIVTTSKNINISFQDNNSSIIEEIAFLKHSRVHIADLSCLSDIDFKIDNNEFIYKNKKYSISQNGKYQIENAIIAIEVANILRNKGYVINDLAIKYGLKNMNLKGRFDVIAKKPYIVADGAHNIDGISNMVESLDKYFSNKKVIYCTSMFKDKEYEKMIEIMCSNAYKFYCFETDNVRTLPSSELYKEAIKYLNEEKVKKCRDYSEVNNELKKLFNDKYLDREEYIIVYVGSLSIMKALYKGNR